MTIEMDICCSGEIELTLTADPSNAEERRFLKRLSAGEMEIKKVKDTKFANSPDERLQAMMTLGSVSI